MAYLLSNDLKKRGSDHKLKKEKDTFSIKKTGKKIRSDTLTLKAKNEAWEATLTIRRSRERPGKKKSANTHGGDLQR